MTRSLSRPYDDLRVVELANDPGGEMTGYLLANMGADVIKVEPPSGAPTRNIGPFVRDRADPNHSLNFWYYNSNKRSIVVDYQSPDGLALLQSLLADADIFLCTLAPAELSAIGLDYDALANRLPRLIIVSVTPFGLNGPWADFRSSDLIGLAAGGPLHMCGYDDHSIPPILPGGNQAFHIASSFAHKALLVALLERQQTGLGQIVDVSMHESCAVTVELGNPYWFYPKAIVQRQTCRHAQPVRTQPAIFECADGKYIYFALIVSEQKPWQALVQWMESLGMAADLSEPAYHDYSYRQKHYSHVQNMVECFFLVIDAETAFHDGQARGLPIGIIAAPEELFDDPHYQSRQFFVDVAHDGDGNFKYPGAPWVFFSFDSVPRERAPNLGEHTQDILQELTAQKNDSA